MAATLQGVSASQMSSPAAQNAFKSAVAFSANVSSSAVSIISITDVSNPGGRHLLQTAAVVNFAVAASSTESASSIRAAISAADTSGASTFVAALNAQLPVGVSVSGVTIAASTITPVAAPPPPPSTSTKSSSLAQIVGAVVGAGIIGPGTVVSIMMCFFKPALRRILLKNGCMRIANVLVPDVQGDMANMHVKLEALQSFMVKQKLPRLLDTTPELQVGDIKLDRSNPLGRGGYGIVFRGELCGRSVAIKALFAAETSNVDDAAIPLDVVKKVKREVAVMCTLNHPNVLQIIGAVPERGWIVMEYCAGGSLKSMLMDPEHVVGVDVQVRLAAEAATGVAYLHMTDVAIVHGDLKADNVLLTSSNHADAHAKLCDFGMAEAKDRSVSMTRAAMGSSGGLTVQWTAPELLEGEAKTYASDVFALGITIWEIFERDTPFGRMPEMIVIKQLLDGKRPPLSGKTPQRVADIIGACWVPEARRRPTADRVAYTLNALALRM
jgi:hypothetical protein